MDRDKSILHEVSLKQKQKLAKKKQALAPKVEAQQPRAKEEGEQIGKRVASSLEDLKSLYSTKKKTADDDWMQQYTYLPSDKASSVCPLEDISNEIDSHYLLDLGRLKAGIVIQEEAKAAPQPPTSSYLVAEKRLLDEDDFDEVDDNQLKELNNDVEFKEYSYALGGEKKKKSRLLFDGLLLEFAPRLCEELSLYEFPSVVDELLPYMDKLSENKLSLSLLKLFASYTDFCFTDAFSANAYSFKKTYLFHVLNHCLHFKQQSIQKLQVNGYTKCRACIFVPFKLDCVEIVEILIEVLQEVEPDCPIINQDKFFETYNDEAEMMSEDFKLGIKLNSRGCSLFADFNKSDIFICTPSSLLAMRDKKLEDQNDAGLGFLSSIELVVVDKANVLKMQNYDALNECLALMNRIPKHHEATSDFNTIRDYYVENLSKFFRQTIVYTDFLFADLNITLDRCALNYKGSLKNKVAYNPVFDVEKKKGLFKIEFNRMDIEDPAIEFDAHFNYFTNQVWMPFSRTGVKPQTVVFVSRYEEFVRLKQYFK